MRKLTTALAGLAFALVSAMVVSASAPPPRAAGGVGFTWYSPFRTSDVVDQVSFTAQGTTTDAKGQIDVSEYLADGTLVQLFHGVVDCYYQDGNTAYFSGVVTELYLGVSQNVNLFFRVGVQDNGEGANAAAPDMIDFDRPDSAPSTYCGERLPRFDVTSGNLQVQ